jgi:adenylate cyclase class 2
MSKPRGFGNADETEHSVMQWEVEQKFRVSDVPGVKARLTQLGASFTEPIEQIDWYFNHPARDFAKTDEAFRLRHVGEKNYITYKGPKIDQATKTRRELELPLPPGSNIPDDFAQVLTALSFRPVAKVKKSRVPGKLVWQGHHVELALDHIDGLGSFMEIEIVADDSDLEAAKESVHSLSKELGLTMPERRSYLELVLSVDT